jgi:hypothetical protein
VVKTSEDQARVLADPASFELGTREIGRSVRRELALGAFWAIGVQVAAI